MTALRFQTGGGDRHPRPPFGRSSVHFARHGTKEKKSSVHFAKCQTKKKSIVIVHFARHGTKQKKSSGHCARHRTRRKSRVHFFKAFNGG